VTHENGDTTWENSSLVNAAITGQIAVLDHVDRLQKDALASLHGLLVDRQGMDRRKRKGKGREKGEREGAEKEENGRGNGGKREGKRGEREGNGRERGEREGG
jgi:hypothetical protein